MAKISFVTAQSLIVSGDTIVSGDSNVLIEHYLDVKNISNNDLDVICVKTVLVLPLDYPTFTGPYFCFAECLPLTIILCLVHLNPRFLSTNFYPRF